MTKLCSVQQGVYESSSAYFGRLMEVLRAHSPMNPEADEYRSSVILALVNQAAPDIRKKLQKIDSLASKSISELMEVANKVYNSREEMKARLRTEENKRQEKSRWQKGKRIRELEQLQMKDKPATWLGCCWQYRLQIQRKSKNNSAVWPRNEVGSLGRATS